MTTEEKLRLNSLWGLQATNDPVNHPSHYTDGKFEVIDIIEDKHLPFHLGNVVKYVLRAGKKDPSKEIEDLEKARWYLDRYIQMKKKGTIEEVSEKFKNVDIDEAYTPGTVTTSAQTVCINAADDNDGDDYDIFEAYKQLLRKVRNHCQHTDDCGNCIFAEEIKDKTGDVYYACCLDKNTRVRAYKFDDYSPVPEDWDGDDISAMTVAYKRALNDKS